MRWNTKSRLKQNIMRQKYSHKFIQFFIIYNWGDSFSVFFNVFFMRWMKHLVYRTSLHLYHSFILVWSLLWKLNPFFFPHQTPKILFASFYFPLSFENCPLHLCSRSKFKNLIFLSITTKTKKKEKMKLNVCSNHRTKFVMLFVLRIRSLFIWIQMLFTDISETSAMMFTSARQNVSSFFATMNI